MAEMRLAALGLLACLCAAATPAAEPSSLEVGSIPEDALGKDIEGNQVRLSDYRGKVVIVSFWASWCGPCRKELPVLAGVQKKFGPEQVKVIAINFQDDAKSFKYVVEVLKDHAITMLRDAGGRTAKKFGVQGIPRMVVLGRDGKVAADHTGYSEEALPEFVDQLNKLVAART